MTVNHIPIDAFQTVLSYLTKENLKAKGFALQFLGEKRHALYT
jgi:hypothetical protein